MAKGDLEPSTFVLFDTAHWAAILGILGGAALLPWLARRVGEGRHIRSVGIALGVVLVVHHVFKGFVRVGYYGFPLAQNLQLNLCDLGIYLGLVMLITGNQRLFELVYFWGLAGTLQAILTPDIEYAFPHLVWWMYFISHGGVIVIVCYAIFAMDLRPERGAVLRVFVATNLYAAFAAVVNVVLDANYLYLCQKPPGASLADFMPAWPWYILVLEVVAIVSFLVYAAPFAIADRLRDRAAEPVQSEIEAA